MSDNENKQIDPIEQHITESVASCPGIRLLVKERAQLQADIQDWKDHGLREDVINRNVKERIEQVGQKLQETYESEALKASAQLAEYQEAFEKQRDKNIPQRQLIRDRLKDKYLAMSNTEFENAINSYDTYSSLSDSEEISIIRAESGRRNIHPVDKAQKGIRANGFDNWVVNHSEKAQKEWRKFNFYSNIERGAFGLVWPGNRISAHSVEDFMRVNK